MEKRIGLIGIGLVGSAIAESLIAGGYEIAGFDIKPERCRLLEGLGGKAAASPRQAAEGRSAVVLSLLTSRIVRQVLEGEDGVFSAELPPRYILDTTTGDPEATEQIARDCAARGISYLDATISGASDQIRRREGVFMVGSEPEAYAACREILDCLGVKHFHVGPPGAGAKSKLAVNLVLGLNRLALAEGLVLAERMGLDLEGFLSLLKETFAYSRVMDGKGPKMVRGDFSTQARLSQHAKDVELILQQARRLGQELPASRTHLEVLKAALAAGDGDLDNAAVIRELRRRGRKT